MNESLRQRFLTSQRTPGIRKRKGAQHMLAKKTDKNKDGKRMYWRGWKTINACIQRSVGSLGPNKAKSSEEPRMWTTWPFIQCCGTELLHMTLLGITAGIILGLKHSIHPHLWVSSLGVPSGFCTPKNTPGMDDSSINRLFL